ncbi:hypothetical protein CAEBREN_01328 [Caenorhabditis brenneri]|uniref:Uncharacterized protein n=1 Tax=Caenorhabditis brenneri TaxID=135651 RepID=G0MMS8_CAEBE|nr:hypothetical protein CAEBREN_01328 [Caenorhabditis brenneri]
MVREKNKNPIKLDAEPVPELVREVELTILAEQSNSEAILMDVSKSELNSETIAHQFFKTIWRGHIPVEATDSNFFPMEWDAKEHAHTIRLNLFRQNPADSPSQSNREDPRSRRNQNNAVNSINVIHGVKKLIKGKKNFRKTTPVPLRHNLSNNVGLREITSECFDDLKLKRFHIDCHFKKKMKEYVNNNLDINGHTGNSERQLRSEFLDQQIENWSPECLNEITKQLLSSDQFFPFFRRNTMKYNIPTAVLAEFFKKYARRFPLKVNSKVGHFYLCTGEIKWFPRKIPSILKKSYGISTRPQDRVVWRKMRKGYALGTMDGFDENPKSTSLLSGNFVKMVREKNKNPIKSVPESLNLVPEPLKIEEPTQLDSTSNSVAQSKSGQKLMEISKLVLSSKTTVQDFLTTLRNEGFAAETVRIHSLLMEPDMKQAMATSSSSDSIPVERRRPDAERSTYREVRYASWKQSSAQLINYSKMH